MSDQLRSIYARWQNLEADKAAISEDLKELFAEAKGNGFDTKALRAAFRLKAMDAGKVAEFAEHETLVDLYLDALGVGTKDAIARTRVAREGVPTDAQRPSNRDVSAGGKPWQDGPPQGHRPIANDDAAFGAELAGHEGHTPKGEDDPYRQRATASPTPSDDDDMAIPAFMRRTA